MIHYANTLSAFLEKADRETIPDQLARSLQDAGHPPASLAEVRSWQEMVPRIARLLQDPRFDRGLQVGLEFGLPLSARRMDLVLAGCDRHGRRQLVILELKLWQRATGSGSDTLVQTVTGGCNREVLHPSLQAAQYARLLTDWTMACEDLSLQVSAMAWLPNLDLHRCPDLRTSLYSHCLAQAPLFAAGEEEALKGSLLQVLDHAPDQDLLQALDRIQARTPPDLSVLLQDLTDKHGLLRLQDRQLLLHEQVCRQIREADQAGCGSVTVITGGPGTGKTVLALRLLATLLAQELTAFYVPASGTLLDAVRQQLPPIGPASRLVQAVRPVLAFRQAGEEVCDCLLVDEAHRLARKDRPLTNPDQNVPDRLRPFLRSPDIDALIRAARHCVFFLDERQGVTLDDACDPIRIRQAVQDHARSHPCSPRRFSGLADLDTQFRCAGGLSFLRLVDRITGVDAGVPLLSCSGSYDVRLFPGPASLCRALQKQAQAGFQVRLAAGSCWPGPRQRSAALINKEGKLKGPGWFSIGPRFQARWRTRQDPDIDPGLQLVDSVQTIQGLETDYIGVLIGPDLYRENGQVLTDCRRRSLRDLSLSHLQERAQLTETEQREADRIIRQGYRVLLTRGRRGCWIWCQDRALAAWIGELLSEWSP